MFVSLISTTLSVQTYAPIGPSRHAPVARAVMLALIAGATGLFVFLLSALAWPGLRRWHRVVAEMAAPVAEGPP